MKGYRVVRVRRRRENKTDYKARIGLLKSNIPRFVVRKTNRYIIAQVIKSKEAQDSTLYSINSKELQNYGYNSSFKNIPASYLTGFLLGVKARKDIKKAILDIGLQRSTKGSKLYAALKGFIDSGVEVSHSEGMLPDEKRIKGEHTKKPLNIEEIKKKIEQGAPSSQKTAKKVEEKIKTEISKPQNITAKKQMNIQNKPLTAKK